MCVEDSLSPIFYARPGKSSANNPPVACGKLGVLEAVSSWWLVPVYEMLPGVTVLL